MTDEMTRRKLGTQLGLSYSILERTEKNKQDITLAAHEMLHTWRKSVSDDFEAWKILASALIKCDLVYYVHSILEK